MQRRDFLAASAAGSLSLTAMGPRFRKENQLRVGCVGVGNRGETNTIIMVSERVTAVCDVDEKYLTPMLESHPGAKGFADWREMLDKEEFDALVISTPNHTHAHIALTALNKGIHVYIEQPIAHTMLEVRRIEAKAKQNNLVAWMGNQHHAAAGYRRAIELIEAKVIGNVKEVHAWTNRPTWPQGGKRPPDGSPLLPGLNWDLWLGASAERGYNPIYHPGRWRGFWEFGDGALGDMGTHLLDPVFWGLKLVAPTNIEPECADDISAEMAPTWSKIKFDFEARGDLPPVSIFWYDGGKTPPEDIYNAKRFPSNGVLLIGELGKMFIPELGGPPRIIPNNQGEVLPEPEVKVNLSRSHHQLWLDACRADKPDHDFFTNCCRLTELCLLGNIALRLRKKLKWVAEKKNFDNAPDATALLTKAYREGWALPK